jgi:hypothetical protein
VAVVVNGVVRLQGGVLFAFEEASSFWSLPLTWKCFFCAATSTFTLNILLSSSSCEGLVNGINSASLITFGTFKDSPYALWELPIFAGLAVMGGLLGALFNQINQKLSVWRRDRGWPKWQKQCECIATAMVTGAVFFILPRLLPLLSLADCKKLPSGLDYVHNTRDFYNQYECKDGMYNPMASLSFAGQEETIHGFFHSFTDETDDDGKPKFIYDTAPCVTFYCRTCLRWRVARHADSDVVDAQAIDLSRRLLCSGSLDLRHTSSLGFVRTGHHHRLLFWAYDRRVGALLQLQQELCR